MPSNVNVVLEAVNKTAPEEEAGGFMDGLANPVKTIRADQRQKGKQTSFPGVVTDFIALVQLNRDTTCDVYNAVFKTRFT